MLGLATFVMRGPMQAGLVGATSLLASLLFPPFLWLGGAAVGLFTLRKGAGPGLTASAVALAGTLLFSALALGSPWPGLIMALGIWGPVLGVALLLRRTVRLELSLLTAGGIATAAVLAIFLTVEDPAAAWLQSLSAAFSSERLQTQFGISTADLESVEWQTLQERIARLMTGMLGVVVLLNTVLSLLLARWWQAMLFNPGGFGAEFQELRLGRVAAGAAALVCLGALLIGAQLLVSLALVVVALYLFQGLAVSHGAVKRRGMSRGWLAGIYVLMVFALPQVTLCLALLGIVDAWADIRSRIPAAPS